MGLGQVWQQNLSTVPSPIPTPTPTSMLTPTPVGATPTTTPTKAPIVNNAIFLNYIIPEFEMITGLTIVSLSGFSLIRINSYCRRKRYR